MRTAGILIVGVLLGIFGTNAYRPLASVESYERGFEEGNRHALKLTPVSHELEMVCAGLWFGGKGEEYWRNKWAKQ
jgi:hypothetical protein